MKAQALSFFALSLLLVTALKWCPSPSNLPVYDDEHNTIAYLEPNAPIVVIRRADEGTRILLSGWVDTNLSNSGLWEVENYPGLLYKPSNYEQGLGYTEMIGVLENRTSVCFDLLTLEVSLWQGGKDGGTVKEVTMDSLRRVLPGERVPFDVLFFGWELDDVLKMTPRFRYRDSVEC